MDAGSMSVRGLLVISAISWFAGMLASQSYGLTIDWIPSALDVATNLIFLFVMPYVLSSVLIGVHKAIEKRILVDFIYRGFIVSLGVISVIGYLFVLPFCVVLFGSDVVVFDWFGSEFLRNLLAKTSDVLTINSTAAVSISFWQDWSLPHNIFYTLANDQLSIALSCSILFSFGVGYYAVQKKDLSLVDVYEAVCRASHIALSRLIYLLPIFAFFSGYHIHGQLSHSFVISDFLKALMILVGSGLLIISAITLLSMIVITKRRSVFLKEMLLINCGSLGSPSAYLFVPVVSDFLTKTIGIPRYRSDFLLPISFLFFSFSIYFSCALLGLVVLSFYQVDIISVPAIFLPFAALFDSLWSSPLKIDLAINEFGDLISVLFNIHVQQFTELIVVFIPVIVVLANLISVNTAVLIVLLVSKWSGDTLNTEELQTKEVLSSTVIVELSWPLIILALTVFCLATAVFMAVGYSVGVLGLAGG
jgi:hypothetical protein